MQIDKWIALAFAALLPLSVLIRPVWRRADPGLVLALAYQEQDALAPYRTWTAGWWRLRGPVEATEIRDAWGRPCRVIGERVGYDAWAAAALVSAGPDGVFGTDDDVRDRRELLAWYLHALFAPVLFGCAALVLRAARVSRPAASLPRDALVSLVLGLPLAIPLAAIGLASLPSPKVPLTVLAATTIGVLAVRRHRAGEM